MEHQITAPKSLLQEQLSISLLICIPYTFPCVCVLKTQNSIIKAWKQYIAHTYTLTHYNFTSLIYVTVNISCASNLLHRHTRTHTKKDKLFAGSFISPFSILPQLSFCCCQYKILFLVLYAKKMLDQMLFWIHIVMTFFIYLQYIRQILHSTPVNLHIIILV